MLILVVTCRKGTILLLRRNIDDVWYITRMLPDESFLVCIPLRLSYLAVFEAVANT